MNLKNTQNTKRNIRRRFACIMFVALLIAPLITFGATQNVTDLNETQPEPENITDMTAPIITIQSPESTTYNATAINLNYTIDEPTEWVGYSLNGAGNVTIIGNITFNAPVGVNHLVVYAIDTAGNSAKAEVQFNVDVKVTTENITNVTLPDVTELSCITPKLSAKKDSFSLDEEPAFTFEYIKEKKGFASQEKASSINVSESDIAAPGESKKAFKRWRTANETIETFVYDCSGKLTDIEPEIEKMSEGKFSIKIPKERAFRAGLYKLSVELVKEEQVFIEEKEFPWGLVSLNTRKSIYKPGERAEFIIVVLDKYGHSVCDAGISMTVTNPDNEKTVYRTGDGTILRGEECGLYKAEYLTGVEGNHTVAVNALIDDVEVSFDTYFLVKQDYAFDIVRTAQSKIDPTRQDWFEVTIDIESFTDADSVIVKEFVPAEFDISTDTATVLLEDDTKTITWNKYLIDGKTSVSYSYSVPHIWPYLYALGPAEIEYDSKSFSEARAWYIAVDPPDTLILRPNGPGSYTEWSIGGTSPAPTNWQSVNETTPDDDVTYVMSYTAGHKDLYNLTDSGLAGGTINSVTVWIRLKKIKASPDAATLIRTHGTDYEGKSISAPSSWKNYSTTYTTNPNTSANWTIAEVDALEAGVVQTVGTKEGQEAAVTQVWVVVDYTPDTTPPSWYDQNQNISKLHKGESVNLSTRWTDNVGLKNATLAHNGTGAWQNVSTIALSGTEAWSNFTLTTGLDWTPGIKGWRIYANDTSDNENVTDVMTFELWGYSNVTWILPPDGSSYTAGETITLTCLVRDATNGSGIQNYPVHFYNRTDSTVTYDFGLNYTNSSGYAVMNWATTGVAPGWYYPKGNITDNATLFYNISAPYEANTSIELSYVTTLEIRNQTNVTAISSINLSGTSGDTVTNPYNDVDGSSSPQNTSTTTPVVTIYNPSSSTNYTIWLKVTAGTGWDYIIKNETFNVTAPGVSPGDVSTWTSLIPWGSYTDSGVTVNASEFKDLYLAFQLKRSGTGTATISVLGEAA